MKKLLALIEVKKIIALLFAIVFCVLSLKNKISSDQFIIVFSTIIGYYFAQSTTRATVQENK